MNDHLVLFTDGGARGNPGPAGMGGVLKRAASGETVEDFNGYLGERTNNQAEYEALIEGLTRASALGATHLECMLDSQLVVEQMKRNYKVKDAELGKLFLKAWNLSQAFSKISFTHIPREKNTEADTLVNRAIDDAT